MGVGPGPKEGVKLEGVLLEESSSIRSAGKPQSIAIENLPSARLRSKVRGTSFIGHSGDEGCQSAVRSGSAVGAQGKVRSDRSGVAPWGARGVVLKGKVRSDRPGVASC